MKECARVRRLLSCYLDRETNDLDTVLIKAHLDNCSSCKGELSGLARSKEFIQAKEWKVLPQDYMVRRLREAIALERMAGVRFPWLADMAIFSRRLILVPVSLIVLSAAFFILSPGQKADKYSLEDMLLSKTTVTTETALGLILGSQD
ncbi:MAG: zf-HC2 domain-containing protein [Candidatus Omnitrophica bacterium]|nr:zf-HC2 domain-containing protein [Candidatus Omnitrophota bacterium]